MGLSFFPPDIKLAQLAAGDSATPALEIEGDVSSWGPFSVNLNVSKLDICFTMLHGSDGIINLPLRSRSRTPLPRDLVYKGS